MAPNSRARSMQPATHDLVEAKAKQRQQGAKQAPSDQMYNPMNFKNNVQLVYFL